MHNSVFSTEQNLMYIPLLSSIGVSLFKKTVLVHVCASLPDSCVWAGWALNQGGGGVKRYINVAAGSQHLHSLRASSLLDQPAAVAAFAGPVGSCARVLASIFFLVAPYFSSLV